MSMGERWLARMDFKYAFPAAMAFRMKDSNHPPPRLYLWITRFLLIHTIIADTRRQTRAPPSRVARCRGVLSSHSKQEWRSPCLGALSQRLAMIGAESFIPGGLSFSGRI